MKTFKKLAAILAAVLLVSIGAVGCGGEEDGGGGGGARLRHLLSTVS